MLGYIKIVKSDAAEPMRAGLSGAKDSTSRWPVLQELKVKHPKTQDQKSICTFVFLGAGVTRRSEKSLVERRPMAKARYEKAKKKREAKRRRWQ